jgi:hypothetical protein
MSIKEKAKDLFNKWNESQKPIVGTVLSEQYENALARVPEHNGIFSQSNETVKLESEYSLKIKTDDGRIIGLSVIDGDSVKKEALDRIIDEGSRVSFPQGSVSRPNHLYGYVFHDLSETYFTPTTQAGTKRADRITVLPKN